jgi:hypothetical protein
LHAFERAVDPELLRVEGRNLVEWTIKIGEACVYKPWKRQSQKSYATTQGPSYLKLLEIINFDCTVMSVISWSTNQTLKYCE